MPLFIYVSRREWALSKKEGFNPNHLEMVSARTWGMQTGRLSCYPKASKEKNHLPFLSKYEKSIIQLSWLATRRRVMSLGLLTHAKANRHFWTSMMQEKTLARVSHDKWGGHIKVSLLGSCTHLQKIVKAPVATTTHPQCAFCREKQKEAGQERRMRSSSAQHSGCLCIKYGCIET